MNNSMFLEMTENEMLYVDGGGLFNEICKGVTSVLGGAVIRGVATTALEGAVGGSVAGPVGTVVGIVGAVAISYLWDRAF